MEKFKYPSWRDIEKFWNKLSILKKLEYLVEGLDCEENNKIIQFISKQNWEDIPDGIQDHVYGWSQLGNDVFDEINL